MAFINFGISSDYSTDLALKVQTDTATDVSQLIARVNALEVLLIEKSAALSIVTQKMAEVITLLTSMTLADSGVG
jgi:hypothetical protein